MSVEARGRGRRRKEKKKIENRKFLNEVAVDVSSRLRDEVDVVSLDDDLILLSLGFLNGNTLEHLDVTDTLLSQEVTKEIREETRVSQQKKGKGTKIEKKLRIYRISTDCLSSEMITLMGKCA